MNRRDTYLGADWDPLAGSAQVVRLGSHIYVCNTGGTNAHGQIVAPGDAYGQALQALRNIEAALRQVGADRSHVTRTRILIAQAKDSEAVSRAHADFFGKRLPATSVAEVSSLSADSLVEIEADALMN